MIERQYRLEMNGALDVDCQSLRVDVDCYDDRRDRGDVPRVCRWARATASTIIHNKSLRADFSTRNTVFYDEIGNELEANGGSGGRR